ncbi:MAG: ARMT1-like domain-containing protein [Clostridium sp.]|uniref:ARMT1-like domain-containing protein n=1 Tax=Clostridium sp. TaxID=1506 RepID=UPI003D6D51EC
MYFKKIHVLYDKHEIDKVKKIKFMKEVTKIISMSKSGDTSPYLSARIMRRLDSELNLGDIYYEIKKEYNTLLLSMEKEILRIIYDSDDKLLTALKYAMVGNFIDFGAMDKVDMDELKNLIYKAPKQKNDIVEYENFVKEIRNAKHIVYIVDNAGEIVFDKINQTLEGVECRVIMG